MECPSNWEYKALIDELTQGKEQAKQLKDQWSSTSSSEVQSLFLQRIISSFEKSLLILNWNGSAASQSQHSHPLVVSGPSAIESSMSVDNSPRSENLNAGLKDQKKLRPNVSKKRKTLPTWTEQVRVSSEHGLEGPSDDGYSWRKYGQKDILGAKFPRSYYRCTYRHVQNCWATKYVQRSDDDPTVFDITYKGSHTCYQSTTNNSVVVPPVSPEKQEMKPSTNQNSHQLQQPNEVLINFRANLRVNTGEELDDNTNNSFAFPSTLTYTEWDNNQLYHTTNPTDEAFMGTYSPAFVSPTTPESNYFSMSNGYMNSLGGTSNWQHYESDLTDIISANASVTNSPNAPQDIPIDHVDLDTNFPFNMSVLFT